jgi:lipoprotein signal peptidase
MSSPSSTTRRTLDADNAQASVIGDLPPKGTRSIALAKSRGVAFSMLSGSKSIHAGRDYAFSFQFLDRLPLASIVWLGQLPKSFNQAML